MSPRAWGQLLSLKEGSVVSWTTGCSFRLEHAHSKAPSNSPSGPVLAPNLPRRTVRAQQGRPLSGGAGDPQLCGEEGSFTRAPLSRAVPSLSPRSSKPQGGEEKAAGARAQPRRPLCATTRQSPQTRNHHEKRRAVPRSSGTAWSRTAPGASADGFSRKAQTWAYCLGEEEAPHAVV